ncbi:hypothetical protein NKI96_02895 [Mesorhizobium sp. M0292]|uniref:hypothetical protein n=1 Tax=Mesorhizobium sp. M0292 TaxID=2956929 RepID=UPI0033388DE5
MSTSTFSSAAPANSWTPVVAGANFSRFALQVASNDAVAVAIATAQPAIDSDDFMILRLGSDKSLLEDLAATDNVYVRGVQSASKVRGYKVGR